MRSRPQPSTSSSSSASRETSSVICRAWRTSATSRTRRRIRFAIRGVPRERARDLVGRRLLDLDVEDARRAAHDHAELLAVVVAEPERHPEPVAQRRRQQPGPRRRADERERRQVDRERARRGALAPDDVETEVLQRRVQDLLGRPVEPVDLVDEEDVVRLDRGEDRGQSSFFSSAGPATVRRPTPSRPG